MNYLLIIENQQASIESLRQQLASLEQEVEQCCYGESLAFAAMRQQLATMTADRAEWKEAHDAGRLAERVVTIKDDDDLRFIKRVLEGNNPAEKDKERCLQLIHEIRSRARNTK